ncbi:hypothetical protein [Arthrobacter tumbae]|nr:hypothetical protein [Arthrobacter tumbae]MBM7782523.1 hypothetical protein [Arthrobacter tumbae]
MVGHKNDDGGGMAHAAWHCSIVVRINHEFARDALRGTANYRQ